MGDMWSVGVVIYVMLCGYTPFKADKRCEMYERIKTGSYSFDPKDWSNISDEAQELVKGLLCLNPDKRLTAKQALRSKWISGVSAQLLRTQSLRSSQSRLKSTHLVSMEELDN